MFFHTDHAVTAEHTDHHAVTTFATANKAAVLGHGSTAFAGGLKHPEHEAVTAFATADTTAVAKLDACSKCMFKWHSKGHILNSCRREIAKAAAEEKAAAGGKQGFFSKLWNGAGGKKLESGWKSAKVSAGSLKQRAGGSISQEVYDCYKRKLEELTSGEFSKRIASGRCKPACASVLTNGGADSTAVGRKGEAAADLKNREDVERENGVTDILMPTLAQTLIERRRRAELALAFL